ncbi:hypothetical protein COT99_03605 [Candidatus Falkowbacteria bacterium CG10_big_fil_rev_8_21_14_0_10_43_10]|uniref:Glycosyltransferase 2-like domain-containing protein n=1 Tax=Candidatus Falkowbacteria bacterium CG10_big_fil_rev_8_21_14_0_10_43_10 TaxID=1974567 RepID=A0A2H0V1D5_9BACT|nr:MAG: hypothetical protein COT99_03605 [Candidatus Falkowbacteria bacterium CG10_big_fil_rev_8_21_14_0_10_43_10]
MDISFIILNYKTKGLVKNCLTSIIESDPGSLNYEIIVVDNASGDGIKEMLKENFSGIKFIQSGKNFGFGGGNNLGIENARGKYLALLNPDIMLLDDSFLKIFNFMESNPGVGIAGPKLVNPDGSPQYTRCRFPELLIPIYRRTPLQNLKKVQGKLDNYLTKDQNYNAISRADWVYGACLFIRKEALNKCGLFDQRFFLGFEDTDLCRRMWNSGYEVWYYPEAALVHYPHRFSGDRNWIFGLFDSKIRIHIQSWIKYFWKYKKVFTIN